MVELHTIQGLLPHWLDGITVALLSLLQVFQAGP